jgi:chaperonin GroES
MNINSIKPILDIVFVEPLRSEEKTKGGIVIPDIAREKPQEGKVLAVGKGKKDEPTTIKTGDIVLYGKYSGTEIQISGVNYLFIKESDIYATIKSK